MPEVETTLTASYKLGDMAINTHPNGDVCIEDLLGGQSLWLLTNTDKANFAALARAYLARIDAAETPEPERDDVARVGDVIEILEDGVDGSGVFKGDLFLVDVVRKILVEVRRDGPLGQWHFLHDNYRIVCRASNTEAAHA